MYGEIWPQKWVMTIDHDAANWKYLQVSGNSIDRTWIPRDFSLKTVADEKECEFIVNKEGEKNGKTMYSFTLAKNKNKRWTTTAEGSLLGTLEYRLSIENRSEPRDNDYYKFYIYEQPKKNGMSVVRIESVLYPGNFLINKGHTNSANGIVLNNTNTPADIYHNGVN